MDHTYRNCEKLNGWKLEKVDHVCLKFRVLKLGSKVSGPCGTSWNSHWEYCSDVGTSEATSQQLLVVPQSLAPLVIQSLHNGVGGGHLGLMKTQIYFFGQG